MVCVLWLPLIIPWFKWRLQIALFELLFPPASGITAFILLMQSTESFPFMQHTFSLAHSYQGVATSEFSVNATHIKDQFCSCIFHVHLSTPAKWTCYWDIAFLYANFASLNYHATHFTWLLPPLEFYLWTMFHFAVNHFSCCGAYFCCCVATDLCYKPRFLTGMKNCACLFVLMRFCCSSTGQPWQKAYYDFCQCVSFLHDDKLYWASLIRTSFEDVDLSSRPQLCWRVEIGSCMVFIKFQMSFHSVRLSCAWKRWCTKCVSWPGHVIYVIRQVPYAMSRVRTASGQKLSFLPRRLCKRDLWNSFFYGYI